MKDIIVINKCPVCEKTEEVEMPGDLGIKDREEMVLFCGTCFSKIYNLFKTDPVLKIRGRAERRDLMDSLQDLENVPLLNCIKQIIEKEIHINP